MGRTNHQSQTGGIAHLNFLDLIESWKDFNIKGVVISESPNIEGDALMLKRLYGED